VKYDGCVGNLNAPWFGSWFFVRKHWLLDGLPTDCAIDWRYGVSAFGGPAWTKEKPPGNRTDGQLLDAPGMEVAIGFGADHNTKVGTSGCVIPYGKGQIVFYCLPQLVRSLNPGDFAISPVVCRRLLGNALRPNAHPMTASAN
jgi:beta-galactosidase